VEPKNFYDDIYKKGGDKTMRPFKVYQDWFKLFGKVKSGGRLADVACGTGMFLKAASDAGLETWGLDISDEAVKVSKQVSPKSNVVQGVGESLPWDSNFFDYVTCLGSLEHFSDSEKGLAELVRIGKVDAKYIIILPNENYLLWRLGIVKKGTNQREFEILKTLDGWKNFLENGGLKINKVYQDKYPATEVMVFENKNPKKIIRRLIYKFIWLVMPLKSTYQFVFVLEKK